MARKIIMQREDGTWPVLTETLAENEAQLQEIVKANPDLLPIDEFDMTGPLLVVGRETALPSGYVDLLCLARGGEIVIVEFKTGPQNTDFRSALAQLLDYGSDLWRLTYDEFERLVALPFFGGKYCADPLLKGKTSLATAAGAVWMDLTEEEIALQHEAIVRQLANGAFHYVVVAQRFTPTMERTVEYLNAQLLAARFYAVELVRFAAGTLAAFESRTVLKPIPQSSGAKAIPSTSETAFLNGIASAEYRAIVDELLDICRALKLRIEWGSKGASLRTRTPDRMEPLTVGWIYSPGVSGWQGLTDLTLGYDPASAAQTPSVQATLDEYVTRLAALPEIVPAKPTGLRARAFTPGQVLTNRQHIREILTHLVQQVDALA